MVVVVNGTLAEHSTRAAREFVLATRARLRLERERHGPEAERMRSYRDLLRALEPEELLRTWPHADVDAALRG